MNNLEKIFNRIENIFDINFSLIENKSFSDNFFEELIKYEYSIEKEFYIEQIKNLFILYYKILTYYKTKNNKFFQTLETRFLLLLNKKFIIEILKEKKYEKNSFNNNKNKENNKSIIKKISFIKNLNKIDKLNNEYEKLNNINESNYIKKFNENLNKEFNKQKLNFKIKIGKKKKIYSKNQNNNNNNNFNDENINILNIEKEYLKTPKKSSNKKNLITFSSNKNFSFNSNYFILNSENSFFNLITPTKCVSSFNLNSKKNIINIKNEQNFFKSKKIKNILNLTIENFISNINKNFYFNNFNNQILILENSFNQKYKEFININKHYINLIKENQFYENNNNENLFEEKKEEIENLNLKYEEKIKNIFNNKNKEFKLNNEIKIYIEQIKWEILLKINEILF